MTLIERETCDLHYHMKSPLQWYSSYIQNRTPWFLNSLWLYSLYIKISDPILMDMKCLK
jgi:hypothetical protein